MSMWFEVRVDCSLCWYWWNSWPSLCIFSFHHIALLTRETYSFKHKPHRWSVCVLASRVTDRGFEPRSDQTQDYKIAMCCFSAKHAALRRKNNNWLARNQDNVSEWDEISIRGLLFQWASTITIHLTVLA